MSEEILEQQSEEELEEQQAVAESSDEEVVEAKAKSEEMEDEKEDDEEEMEESFDIPKTKAGMVKAIYDQINSMKKADLSDSFGKIMGSTLAEEEEMDDDEDEEEMKEVKKLSKEELEINVKEDIDAMMGNEELSEEFKTKAATIFEAAVSAKVIEEVNNRIGVFEENYKKELKDAKEEHQNAMSEKVD